MRFPQPLRRGVLIRRYKRFLAEVVLDGEAGETTVHVPNPGAMLGLADPGLTVWLSRHDRPSRKLPWTLELVEADGAPVGVNTMLPNRLVAEALAADGLAELSGYDSVRPEVKYGEASRVDFLLQGSGRPPCWLEVKNVHLRRAGRLAEFPDCVAARSARHLKELSARVVQGERAVALFVVQRTDCDAFAPARDLDPAFAAAFSAACAAGVEVLAYACDVGPKGVAITRRLPLSAPER